MWNWEPRSGLMKLGMKVRVVGVTGVSRQLVVLQGLRLEILAWE